MDMKISDKIRKQTDTCAPENLALPVQRPGGLGQQPEHSALCEHPRVSGVRRNTTKKAPGPAMCTHFGSKHQGDRMPDSAVSHQSVRWNYRTLFDVHRLTLLLLIFPTPLVFEHLCKVNKTEQASECNTGTAVTNDGSVVYIVMTQRRGFL